MIPEDRDFLLAVLSAVRQISYWTAVHAENDGYTETATRIRRASDELADEWRIWEAGK